tara:strand:- start:296 stop:2131 length:1836 start_codon:yes stop_codon:yes gene_type:complete
MAKYKTEKGFAVQTLAGDTIASQVLGGTWASGGDLNTNRFSFDVYLVGTQTDSMGTGGYNTASIANNEKYDGTSWSEVNDLPTAKSNGMGSGSAAEAYTGFGMTTTNVNTTETWDGTNWTSANAGSTARRHGTAFGNTTTGIAASGFISPGSRSPAVESWNGTSWSEVAEMSQPRDQGGGLGSSYTLGLVAGGGEPSASNKVESWNGTSWTETTEINTARSGMGAAGPSTNGIIFGGGTSPPYSALTEYWNGSSWTELNDLATARSRLGGGGTTVAGLAFGGYNTTSAGVTTTEEWNAPVTFTQQNLGQVYFNSATSTFKVTQQAIPGGTWASGGSMSQSKSSQANIGSSTANNTVGGQTPSPAYLTNNEQYDGTSWSEVNDLSVGRQVGSGIGTSAAGLIAGGRAAPNSTNAVESWDGNTFSSAPTLNQARGYARGAGTQTAAINIGGYLTTPATRYALVEEYNGTSWSETTDMNAVRSSHGIAQASPYTSTIVFGGDTGPAPSTTSSIATAETWDGTTWTEVNDLNEGRRALGGAGNSITSAIAFGGSSANTEFWDGTTWTEVNNLSDARSWAGNSGSTTDALTSGDEPFSGATEEWTVNITNATITAT